MDAPDAITLDDLAARLTEVRLRAGSPSYAEIARRIAGLRAQRGQFAAAPGRITVYDAFRAGRSRMDIELVTDIVAVLGRGPEVPAWRRAHADVLRRRATARGGRISTARAEVSVHPVGPHVGTIADAHTDERDHITSILVRALGDATATPFAVISGLPGVGKSTLARAVADAVAVKTGAGLVIDAALRTHAGNAAEGAPDPGDVAAEVLRMRAAARPAADAATIVVLDDVTSLDDLAVVAGALPERSAVIATSRRKLPLPTGATDVVLEPLDTAGAEELLRRLLSERGLDRLLPDGTDEPGTGALTRLAQLTGGLPLGAVVLTGQVASQPGWSLEDHVERLTHTASAALVPTLATGYARLPRPARQALHLLAQHPGRLDDSDAAAYLTAASIASSPAWSIAETLDELVRDCFLERTAGGRYQLHDVVRALADEHAAVEEPLSLRRASAAALSLALVRVLEAHPLSPETLATFDRQVEVHLSTVDLCSRHGLAAEVLRHAEALHPWLHATHRWNDTILLSEHTRRLATPAERPVAERRLCQALMSVGRLDEAEVILTGLAATASDDPLAHHTTGLLGAIAQLRGDIELSLELTQGALLHAHAHDDDAAILWMSGQMSEPMCDLGRSTDAVATLEHALSAHPGRATPLPRISALIDLGVALAWSDRLDEARLRFVQAREEAAAIGHRAMVVFSDGWLSGIDVLRGRVAEGRAGLALADHALDGIGREGPRTWMKILHADACLRDRDVLAGRALANEALALGERHRFADMASHSQVLLARASILDGDTDAATAMLEVVRSGPTRRARVHALELLGMLAEARGEAAAARALWHEALSLTPAPLFAHRLNALLDR